MSISEIMKILKRTRFRFPNGKQTKDNELFSSLIFHDSIKYLKNVNMKYLRRIEYPFSFLRSLEKMAILFSEAT